MKFGDIMKRVANVGSGVFLGVPVFAEKDEVLIPQNTSNKIVAAIATVEHFTTAIESMKGMSPSDKLAAAAALSRDSILLSSALAGGKIDDVARFDVGVSKITDGWNDVIKSMKKA